MEFDGEDNQIMAPPNLVTLSPFTPMKTRQSRRLSSHFLKPHPLIPIQSVSRSSLAWLSLQGRLVDAEEASSAKAVGFSCLSAGEVVAWKLFSPIHRILIVAVVAVAAANSEKNREIHRLQKCVQLRDQILASMQEKLDCLCEQVNVMKDQAEPTSALGMSKCWLCDQHRAQLGVLKGNATSEAPEMFKSKMSFPSEFEPEERRMSDLSDWASTVASSIDIQILPENLAIDQDVYNLKKECEEKDYTIRELSEYILSKDAASLKRVEELEDIIRQKAMIITKLRKDVAVLEQKVVQLTRLGRRSFSGQVEQSLEIIPAMRDNLLYDMDSSTSPSSSDSDYSDRKNCSVKIKEKETLAPSQDTNLPTPSRIQHSLPAKMSSELLSAPHNARLTHVRPLQEKSMNQRSSGSSSSLSSSSSYKRTLSTSGDSKSRRRAQAGVKVATPSLTRWV